MYVSSLILFTLFATTNLTPVSLIPVANLPPVSKFTAGVVDTGDKFAAVVIDTGGAPWLANIPARFRKNYMRQKFRYSVPLTL